VCVFCCIKVSFFNEEKKNFFFLDFSLLKMRGATSAMYNDHLSHVTLKIWFKTGSMFEEIYPLDKTTFAEVKYSAVRQFLTNNNLSNYRRSSFNTIATSRNNLSLDEIDNYKLISMGSKRMVEEDKTLGQQKVKDGGLIHNKDEFHTFNSSFTDEYLLAPKNIIQYPKAEQVW
jgi:hypothetical protein